MSEASIAIKRETLNDESNILTGIMIGGAFSLTPITRVPAHYLTHARCRETDNKVMTNNGPVPLHIAAEIELKRRGERLKDIYISLHAIDRFSALFCHTYLKERKGKEGLVTFLERTCLQLTKSGKSVIYGIKFQIKTEGIVPVLATVYGAK